MQNSGCAPAGVPPLRIAYLVSQYPTLGHSYIFREIAQLRKLAIEIDVASIAAPDRPHDRLTPAEQEEASRTHYVKSCGAAVALWAQIATLLSRPAGYLRGLAAVPVVAGWNPFRLVRTFAYFLEAVLVGRWMMRQHLTHFHTHFSSTVGLLLVRVFPVTMSMTVHGPDEFIDPGGFRLRQKVRACLFVCTISSFGRSQVMRVSDPEDWEKIAVAPLGVDPAVFAPAEYDPHPSCWRIICVARLARVKAQPVLIGALALLLEQGRNVTLRLVGDGPDREMIRRRAAELGLDSHIRFDGWLGQDAVLRAYAESHICVLPSFAEGVPVSLMEAMAMQLPCVSTYIAGIPELIRDGIDGLLAPASDEERLAEAIGRIIDSPELRRTLSRAGRERICAAYNLELNTLAQARLFRRYLSM